MFRTLTSLWHLARAGFVLAQHDALLPAEYQKRMPASGRMLGRLARLFAHRDRKERPGQRLARALARLGPAYVKLGQLLSTRADLVGESFATDLASLQDRMAPFALDETRRIIAEETGAPSTRLFASIEPARNAASVAQVHRATLGDGRVVALKVLRPGIERGIARDLDALALAAGLAERILPKTRRLRPTAFVETLAAALRREQDLRLEAASASELADIAVTLPDFDVPQIDWARTGKHFLTMEFVEAIALTDPLAMDNGGIDRPALARTVIETFLTCALEHGVFHADMHEGNLYCAAPSRLIAIDFGIVGRIGPDERRYLAEILYGFLKRDYERIADVHFEAGYVPAHQSRADFASALRAVGEPIFGKTADQVSMARVLLHLFDVTELFDMALRPELVLLQKTMVQAEGVARRVDPAFDMWGAAEPVVTHYILRELGPEGVVTRFIADARRTHAALREFPTLVERWKGVNPKDLWEVPAGRHPLWWVALGLVAGVLLTALL